MELTQLANKVGIAAVVCLIGAFALTTFVLVTPAPAKGDVTAVRDDDAQPVAAVSDDDDDDDTDTHDGNNTDSNGSGSGSRSIGSRSANTASGTTRGTGVSRSVSNSSDKSRNTATGTTRGTGPSRSVSNSS